MGTEQLKPRKLYKLSAARHEQGKRRIATRRSCGVEFRCYLGRKFPILVLQPGFSVSQRRQSSKLDRLPGILKPAFFMQ